MSEAAGNESLKFAVLFYGADFLPQLRKLSPTQIRTVADEASHISLTHPLHHCPAAEFVVPAWDKEKKLTSGQVIALMVFSLWIICGENEQTAAPLVEAWPIREAVLLAKK